MSISKVLLFFTCSFSINCVIANLAPKLGPVVDNQKRNLNSSFQIFCAVQEGEQPFFFEWYKNAQPIKPGLSVKWNIESSEMLSNLKIERIAREDTGNYSCLVKNIYGSDSIHVILTVKGRLYLIVLC